MPMSLDVNAECLDNGSGISNSMKTNKAIYHNGCRVLFCSGMLQRQFKKKETDSANAGAAVSPKKTRLSYKATLDREKAYSANCGKYLLEWALQSQNWVVHARLNNASNTEDAHCSGSGIHYHASWYTKLKTKARAATKSSRSTFHQKTYDPLIIAQLLALVKCNNSPQKVLQMKNGMETVLKSRILMGSGCLSEPVAKPLLTLINVRLQGSSTIAEAITGDDQANISATMRVACTISQLICNNSTNHSSQAITLYQRKDRQTPFSFYLGLKFHFNDRQKENKLGSSFHKLSVSGGKRMQSLCTTNIKRKVFVTTVVDNIDESGRYELHGTAMTLTSHSTYDNIVEDPPPLTLNVSESCTVELPALLFMDMLETSSFRVLIMHRLSQHLNMVVKDSDGQLQEAPVTYSGFFSNGQNSKYVRPRSTVGVFPMLYKKSATMAMQKHCRHIAMKATEFVNPGQIPVLVKDCPL
ncbi:hypothetical protein FQA39_LY02362 [Lamprigera yunnana]|nr:hypothetical protein FQA39_LY02362 [Lamprigera yunnana]